MRYLVMRRNAEQALRITPRGETVGANALVDSAHKAVDKLPSVARCASKLAAVSKRKTINVASTPRSHRLRSTPPHRPPCRRESTTGRGR
eukprot:7744044-Pyramimonas_sp.AAC.1